ncbi:flagellin [Halanaerobium congolense]|jgi:flagellin-like hook-associated protein FlgL|uniref:flagellin n=1 Tax=Halanaerobium congolense TaxID=54121 RepID=UPI00105DA9AB
MVKYPGFFRIKDLDIAKEISDLTITQILQQSSLTMQAHSKPIDSNILNFLS